MKKAKCFLVCTFWLMAAVVGNNALAEEFVTADFIRFASAKSMNEVAAAKLALNTSNSSEVKVYAQRRLAEHAALRVPLEALAQREGIALDRHSQGAYVFIRKGETFDTAYAHKRAAELKRMVRVMRKAMLAENPEVRRYAEQALPVLMQHWYQVQHLVRALNNPVSTDSLLATR